MFILLFLSAMLLADATHQAARKQSNTCHTAAPPTKIVHYPPIQLPTAQVLIHSPIDPDFRPAPETFRCQIRPPLQRAPAGRTPAGPAPYQTRPSKQRKNNVTPANPPRSDRPRDLELDPNFGWNLQHHPFSPLLQHWHTAPLTGRWHLTAPDEWRAAPWRYGPQYHPGDSWREKWSPYELLPPAGAR